MDTRGTCLRSRVVDGRFAYDDGCFGSALSGDLSESPTNFGADGKNLLAGFGRSGRLPNVARRDYSSGHKPRLLYPCSLAAYQACLCSSSDRCARDCRDEQQVPGIGTSELSEWPCQASVWGDPIGLSSDSHFHPAWRGLPEIVFLEASPSRAGHCLINTHRRSRTAE